MTECPLLAGVDLAEVISGITNGVCGMQIPSQNYMYYIYRLHQYDLKIYNDKVDIYKFVKTVAGSTVEPMFQKHKEGLLYAIDFGNKSWNWLFSDNLFQENS